MARDLACNTLDTFEPTINIELARTEIVLSETRDLFVVACHVPDLKIELELLFAMCYATFTKMKDDPDFNLRLVSLDAKRCI